MKAKLLILLLTFFCSIGKAQEKELLTDAEESNTMLELLDATQITSGILYDLAAPFAALTLFNTTANTSNEAHFEQALHELYRASNGSAFVPPITLQKQTQALKTKNIVPVGIINATFQSLNYNPKKIKEGGLLLKNGMFEALPGKPAFLKNQALVIAPLKEYVCGPKVTFGFSDDFILNPVSGPSIK